MNGRVSAAPAALVLTLVLTSGLAFAVGGCSAAEDPGTSPSPSRNAPAGASGKQTSAPADAATGTAYLPVPETVALTAQGTDLALGDTATVAWEPRRQVVGALDITVTRLEHARLEALAAFRLEPAQRRSSLYYVRATVRNVGETDLAGVAVPLYAVDGSDMLIEATPFAVTYKPCPSRPMPKPFKTGDQAKVCLVYLVPEQGTLKAVSFRPTQEYDPITWDGRIHQVTPPKKGQ